MRVWELRERWQEQEAYPWLVLISVGLGLFMVVIDVTILNVALPTLAGDLNASLAEVEWTLIAYSLALTGLVPVFGRTSDILGRKRLFIMGVLTFAATSFLAGMAPSILWLIAARLLQAIGGALITSNVLAIITDTFPPGKRGMAMGAQAILISGGAAVGPTLGGFLVTNFGWRAIFFVNVPIGILVASLGAVMLSPLKSNRTAEPLDWAGATFLFFAMGSALLGVTKAPDWGWSSVSVLGLIAFGLVLLMVFIWQEMRSPFPVVDLSLFKIREFAAGQAAGLFATTAMATVMLMFPFYWQGPRGYSAQTAGLLMMPVPLTLMLVAPVCGRLSDVFGSRGLASAGLAVIIVALLLVSTITADMPIWQVMWRLVVFGFGLGMFLAPNNNAVMSAAPASRRGIAAGLLGMSRYAGRSVGVGLAGTAFATFATSGGFALNGFPSPADFSAAADPASRQALTEAFMNGMQAVALLSIPIVAVGMFLSLLRGQPEQLSVATSVLGVQSPGRSEALRTHASERTD